MRARRIDDPLVHERERAADGAAGCYDIAVDIVSWIERVHAVFSPRDGGARRCRGDDGCERSIDVAIRVHVREREPQLRRAYWTVHGGAPCEPGIPGGT